MLNFLLAACAVMPVFTFAALIAEALRLQAHCRLHHYCTTSSMRVFANSLLILGVGCEAVYLYVLAGAYLALTYGYCLPGFRM